MGNAVELVELKNSNEELLFAKLTLEKFDRSRILEVYFTRIDDKIPEVIPQELEELYSIDLNLIKTFLLNQKPYDHLLHKIFGIMS